MQLRNRDALGNLKSPPNRRADAAYLDFQLGTGMRIGRVGDHRPTIDCLSSRFAGTRRQLWRGLHIDLAYSHGLNIG